MATITIYASTGVSRIDLRTSNGITTAIGAGESYSFTRLDPNSYITITNADGQSGYGGPYYANGVNIGGGYATYYTSEGDQNIYVRATAHGYTLTYNGNGATGGSTAQQAGSNQYTVRSCGFTRTGYTFLYWATTNGTVYRPGDTITLYSNTTLKAQWKANTYTISYNANGGSGAPANQTKTYGVTLTLSSVTPTWSGHTFLAWGTSSARDAPVAYNPGGSYTNNESVTLYAIWLVKASFYSQGSLYYESYVRINGSITCTSIPNTSTQGLKGWRINGEGTLYSPGASIPGISTAINVYAIWENIYTVSYNANGGSGAPASQTKWKSENLTLSSDKPTWSGHSFYGWGYTADRNTELQYTAGGTYSINESKTLYAIWRVTASFYSKGTLYRSMPPVRIGGTVICPSIENTSTEVFGGWRYGDNEIYQAGASLPMSSDRSLYAIWLNGYKLTYDGNNADSGSMPSPPLAITYTISPCAFVRNGFFFKYWAYADEYDQTVIVYPGDKLTPKSNLTLYAQWKPRAYFYWHGSDETDSARFAVGQKIENALTASAWNSLCDFINEVRTDARLSTIAFASVSVGDEISAVKFNIVSNAIRQIVNAGYGTVVPATVSAGDEIVTSLFNGRGSLKDAINKAVDDL